MIGALEIVDHVASIHVLIHEYYVIYNSKTFRSKTSEIELTMFGNEDDYETMKFVCKRVTLLEHLVVKLKLLVR